MMIDSMKRNIFIISVALVLSLVSCDRKVDFKSSSFASFDAASYVFDEDAGEVSIPVVLYNPTDEKVYVTFKTIDGKAKEGVDYEVVNPINGVLELGAGVNSVDIVLEIKEDTEMTGSKDFQLSIASASEGFSVSSMNVTKVKIKDLNHPLKRFIGEWTATVTGYSENKYSWTVTIEGDETDPTYNTLLIYDLEPAATSMYGLTSDVDCNILEAKFSEDKEALVIPDNHFLGMYEPGDGQQLDFTVRGLNGPALDSATNYADIELYLNDSEDQLRIPNCWGLYGPTGDPEIPYNFHEAYYGGLVLNKK